MPNDFEQSKKIMGNLLKGDPTIKKRELESKGSGAIRCCLYFSDGLVDSMLLSEAVIKPVLDYEGEAPNENILDFLGVTVFSLPEVRYSNDTDEMISCIMYGDALLFAEGQGGCLIIGCKNFPHRAISEPEDEKVDKGPKEGFVEPLMVNVSLLKRKLRTNKFKIETITLGDTSGTLCAICYLEGIVDLNTLKIAREKISQIKIDGVFSSNYVTEMIVPKPFSFLKRVGNTARPDVAASKLLEGRVVIIVDGSPQILTIPFVFLEHFHSPEDYYNSYHQALIARALRMFAFLLAISIVPIYISIINFHAGTLPVGMLMEIAEAQNTTPFSALQEAMFLLLAFDILREAGIHSPSSMGQTLSIVGALILGQSAVEASLASPPMVIAIAMSGVTGMITKELRNHVTFLRFGLLFICNFAGLWGYVMGTMILYGHIATIEVFGVDYLSNMPLTTQGSHEDSFFRLPFPLMKKYNRFLARGDKK